MNSFSLLVGLSTALIIVLAVAAVLIAGGIAGVLISGKIAANRGGKRVKKQPEEKQKVKADKKPAAPVAKKVEEKPVQPEPVKVEEERPEPVEEVAPEVTAKDVQIEPVNETIEEPKAIEVAEVVEEVAEVAEPEPEAVEEVAEVAPEQPEETIEEPEAVEIKPEPEEAVEEIKPLEGAIEEATETLAGAAVEEPVQEVAEPEAVEEVAEVAQVEPETEATEPEPQPEAQPEVIAEPVQPEPQPEPIPEPVAEQKPESKVEVVKSDDGNAFVRIRYNRSFTAKLIQADDKVKNYYSQIKNELKKYPVKERTSWRYETFKKGRKLLAKITLRGKTLCLYCALNAADYEGTKYKVEDVSSEKSNADVPARFKIKNDRRAKYSEKIIADLMAKHSLEAGESRYEDYAAQYPYEELEPLIERKLVKLLALKSAAAESEIITLPVTGALPQEVLEEVAAAEPEVVEELVEVQPVEEVIEEPVEEVAEEPVEEEAAQLPPEEVLEEVSVTQADEILPDEKVEIYIKESEKVSDKTKRAIVNIDTLGKYFKANEKVTLEEIKRRVQGVNKKTTYIKILARGTLDKPLEVEADDFSPAAVKMIILTGGKVNRTRKSKK